MSLYDLYNLVKNNLIDDLYEKWLRYEFKYPKYDVTKINHHKKTKKIYSLEQLRLYLLSNRPESDEIHSFFALFLSFLDDDSIKDVMNMFIDLNYIAPQALNRVNPLHTIVEILRNIINRVNSTTKISYQVD